MDALNSVRDPERWSGAFTYFARGASSHWVVRDLAERIVTNISEAFSACGSPVRVALDIPDKRKRQIENLIVFDGARTVLVPLQIGANLIHVGGVPVFVGHDGGPMLAVHAFADAIEKVMNELP
jgi:hypothetical protein